MSTGVSGPEGDLEQGTDGGVERGHADTVGASLRDLPEPRFSPEELADLLGQHRPTPQQSEIISSPLEPRLVVAGAGSGKTATMADRVVWLVANGWVRPDEILGVTFTRKAAGELSARIRTQLARLARFARRGVDGIAPSAADPEALDPAVSTYHSFANTVVQDHGLRLGVERDAVLLGPAQSFQLAARVVEAYDGGTWDRFPAKSTLIAAVTQMAGECAEHLREPAAVAEWLEAEAARLAALPPGGRSKAPTKAAGDMLRTLQNRALVGRLAARYAEAKRERGVLDYGDLVSLAARVATTVPEAGALLRSQYRAVILDEFQDTSHAQLVLFSALFGGGHPVTAVGDPNQSIYGFRGASAGQLQSFPGRFPRRTHDGALLPASTSHLTTAWRNTMTVLATANIVASPLAHPPTYLAAAGGADVRRLEPRPGAGAGRVRVGRFVDERQEAAALADELEGFVRGWPPAAESGPTLAVLCRKRSQFAPIRAEFDRRGLPYEVVGLGGLLDTPEIVDVVATLRVIADPGRSDALMRLLAGARWRIGTADLMALADWSRHLAAFRASAARPDEQDLDAPRAQDDVLVEGDLAEAASLVEALDRLPKEGWTSGAGRTLTPEGRSRLVRLRDELRLLRTVAGDDLGTVISHVEHTLLLDIELAARPATSVHEARRNIDAFAEAAASFLAQSNEPGLLAFLAWLDAAANEESGLDMAPREPTPGAIQLLTVHASKGLEWDAVAVAGLNRGMFPSGGNDRWTSGPSALPWPLRGDRADLPAWDADQPDQKGWMDAEKLFAEDATEHAEREDRRLAYVAFTRARSLLVATGFAWTSTRSRPMESSPFLDELHAAAGEEGFEVIAWTEGADVPEENPLRAEAERSIWPYDPLEGPLDASTGRRRSLTPGRRAAVEAAAVRVLAELHGLGAAPVPAVGRTAAWSREAELLLAEQARTRSTAGVRLPEHVSASTLVALGEDRNAVVRQLRRPVPRRPGMAARRGTAFHAWVEEHYGSSAMLDLEGFDSSDEYVDEAYELGDLVKAFKRTEWADRRPAHVEVPIETRVGPVVVRGRIDAVFRDADGGWELVDWKTGRAPRGSGARARSVQLAVYRLAWSRLTGAPLESIRAAFCYLADGTVVRPDGLAGEDELEALVADALSPGDV
ncbi:ATP-dependent DNA helicase [Sinomonas cyclohexanicum]|uniref:DNA 3'-5' helicase n=1 Tax=Sinomonas cyclohexanicum TaxID=322009 RepID=A0ABM7PXU5_SINCY|nr:ATP-dependent DNA helicase [Corynebacterium cyclohexanicum]BCT76835.1 ATP-dependent DNA helicase [Corynebacterium cyclohexanicum]